MELQNVALSAAARIMLPTTFDKGMRLFADLVEW